MSSNSPLRRHFWLVPLPLVAVAAYLNAQAVTQLVGMTMAGSAEDLAHGATTVGRGVAGTTSSTSRARTSSAQPILARNPFDHVAGSLLPAEGSETASGDGDASSTVLDTSDPLAAPTCEELNVNAVAASSDVDWSFASISGGGADKKSHLLRRGGEIGGKTVYFVGRDRVWFVADAQLCQVRVFEPRRTAKGAPAASLPPPAASSAAPPRGVKPLDPTLRKGIQQVSSTEFNIDRGVVDKILENQAELMRQARIVPVQENGRVTGVRLQGVRPDALLGVLGMQNGDQLQTINGFEVASPEKALEAYARLRTADKLTIQLNRAGKTVNLDYNIK